MCFSYRLKALSCIEKEVLKDILEQIKSILDASKHKDQREEIDYLLNLLKIDDAKFIKELNGVAMWGGAGAVWEVFIDDAILFQKFVGEIIKLVEYMKCMKIINKKNVLECRKKTLIQDVLKM